MKRSSTIRYKLYFIFWLLTLTLSGTSARAIVGGSLFTPSNYKYSAIVGIHVVNGATMEICTGTLLNPTTVLTAAHCFDKMNPGNITLFKSVNINNDRRNSMNISKSQVIIHKEYSISDRKSLDFAIIKLNRPFKDSDLVHYPTLLSDTKGEHYGLFGYGFDENNRQGALKKVFKTKADLVKSEDKFLLFDQSNGQGICNGDSGGPLVVRFDDKVYIIAINNSVTHAKKRCDNKGYFIKIEPVIDWIKSYM